LNKKKTGFNKYPDQKLSNEERVKVLSDLYARAREKIRQAGGMKTTRQAMDEIMQEAHQKYRQALDEMIATEEDEDNRAVLQRWKKDLSPAQVLNEIDISIAWYLKEVQKTDPSFYWFKLENHPDDPQKFDELLQDLKMKGLM
jgi:hypothetical protein